jgi:hypothetical protein
VEEKESRMGLSPLQQALLLCGLAGLILGVLLTLAGLHQLAHRGEYDPAPPPGADDDTAEFAPVQAEPPARGRW